MKLLFFLPLLLYSVCCDSNTFKLEKNSKINSQDSDDNLDDSLVTFKKHLHYLIVQENEIIRLNLKEYFGGSFLNYTLLENTNHGCDDGAQFEASQNNYGFLNLSSEFYNITDSGKYSMKKHVDSLPDTLRLLTWHEQGYPEKTYLLYVTEDYHLKFVDVTEVKTDGEIDVLKTINLMTQINLKYNIRTSIEDTFCNSLSTVKTNELYILGCKHQNDDFAIWISLKIYPRNIFSLTVLPRKAEFHIDSRGRNSISTGLIEDYCYIIATTNDYSGLIQVSVFDTSQIKKKKIEFIDSATYNVSDFIDPFENRNLEGEFNFRDVIYYKSNYKYKDDEVQENHHIIASCYNCGIIFFKIQKYEADKTIGHRFLNLTYMYKKSTLGRIFTEKSFNLKNTDFKFFTSIASPPVIYEFLIDESANVNVNKVFSDNIRDNRYKDCELISVNAKYIAQLLYDRKLLKQVIRVYDRNETNFSVGHIHIPLNGYRYDISGIQFLSYLESNKIFVRNPEKWEIYDILDPELIIDTFHEFDYKEQNFTIKINAKSPLESSWGKTLDVCVVCVGSNTMTSYMTLANPIINISYAYGDPSFKFPISDYFIGPDLRFKIELVNVSDGNMNITLPIVQDPSSAFPKIIDTKFNQSCSEGIFSQYKDLKKDKAPMISYYCIHSTYIEHQSFKVEDMSDFPVSRMTYRHSNFIAYYHDISSRQNRLILLSKDQYSKHYEYSLNFFDIKDGLLVWMKKINLGLKNVQLRQRNTIKKVKSNYIAVFSKFKGIGSYRLKSEIYFINEHDQTYNFKLEFKKKEVRDIFMYKEMYVYFTFSNDTEVSVYKVYQTNDEKKSESMSTQHECTISVHDKYRLAHIGKDGISIFFSGLNKIDIYSLKNPCNFQFERTLPFSRSSRYCHSSSKSEEGQYSSCNSVFFHLTKDTYEPVYERNGKFLFVVVTDSYFDFLKYLLIFDIKTNSHDSLVTQISLGLSLGKYELDLYTERIVSSSLVAIYVSYTHENNMEQISTVGTRKYWETVFSGRNECDSLDGETQYLESDVNLKQRSCISEEDRESECLCLLYQNSNFSELSSYLMSSEIFKECLSDNSGVQQFRYYEFQPNNFLKSADSSGLFMPIDSKGVQDLAEKQVILKLSQDYSSLYCRGDCQFSSKKILQSYFNITVANRGLMIEQRPEERLYKFPQSDEPMTFSVLDIFDGFDMSYDPLQIGGNTEDVDLDMSEDKISKFILDGVSLNNPVSHALVYKKKYLLAFYEKDYKLEIYNLANSSDIPFPDSYKKQLDSCNIDYISTFTLVPENSINDTTMFYLVCNCRINDTGINPSYRLQFYQVIVRESKNYYENSRFYTNPIESMTIPLDRKVKDVKVSKSQTGREDHHIVILADSNTIHDSVLLYYGLNIDEELIEYKLTYYSQLNALQMNYEKFNVNSFMFIHDYKPNDDTKSSDDSKFMVCSVDDFGLLFYDLVRLEKADEVAFSEFFTSFYPEFKITNLVPISNNSMRIFLENKGSISLGWKDIQESNPDGYILDGLQYSDRFENLNGQQSTGIVDYSDLSIVQVGYNLKKGGYLDAFVRVERHMNHVKSKSFREYNLGPVPDCSFIDLQCSEDRIVVICGAKYYIINYHPFPSLKVTKHSKATSSTFQLKASNSYSEASVLFEIGNTDTTTLFSKWGILFIFVAVVLILTWCIRCTFRQVVKAKPDSDSVILASEPSSVKDVKFSHDASTEVLKKIKLTYASRATFRKSVKMKRGYSEFHDDVEFDLTYDDTEPLLNSKYAHVEK
ncbi:unnamed protein product [Moneuplotes crassus]|uniref:Uncharacterized protein n=2 Tax=Euplotes crassus TaxID=5936 RepID=A0AAD2D8W8_EUPCR|nr:unnamed protein product [Moneuplotes crassus]